MHTLLTLVTFVSLAHAEPPTRTAQMFATYASGYYEPTRGATVTLTSTENDEPYAITVTVPGRKLTAWVWNTERSRCGDRMYARLNAPDEGMITDVTLTDFSNVRCRLYVRHKWHATVLTHEADGSESKLLLEGDPE